MRQEFDYIILGAGIYGLYSAKVLGEKGFKVAVLEFDSESFQRASYINQARVHNGYHYPRSYSTAIKSAKYFDRFNKDFDFAINNKFKKVYAISSRYSLASGEQFAKFCTNANILCNEISPKAYFNEGTIEAAFETEEYAFDAMRIRDWFIEKIKDFKDVSVFYNVRIDTVELKNGQYVIILKNGDVFVSSIVLNATYASINQIIDKFGFEKFKIKYEVCEIITCTISDNIKDIGITVMDGPFFSVMPFGLDGLHSLTSVTFTPHKTSYDYLPTFNCQSKNRNCTVNSLENCNLCTSRPKSAWSYMHQLSKKYLIDSIEIKYKDSLFAIKPILMASEVDDSRPTVIRTFSDEPRFISVLSGKINTIYDLDGVLQ